MTTTYIYIYIRTPTRLHYPARLRARVKMDFDGIDAEWHFFFATLHGKWPCDGIGGIVKRLAAKASLQQPYSEQIMTPRQLFQFAEDNISGISIFLLHHSGLGRGGQILTREIPQGKNDRRNTQAA